MGKKSKIGPANFALFAHLLPISSYLSIMTRTACEEMRAVRCLLGTRPG
jgi:hypothetical protein